METGPWEARWEPCQFEIVRDNLRSQHLSGKHHHFQITFSGSRHLGLPMDNASLVGWNLRTRKFGVIAFAIAICEPIVIYGPIFFFQGKHMPDQLVSVLGWLYL